MDRNHFVVMDFFLKNKQLNTWRQFLAIFNLVSIQRKLSFLL